MLNWLINRAKRTPYFHLHHTDGSVYMERYWLVPWVGKGEGCYAATWRQPLVWLLQRIGVSVRVHCIHTADLDRHMHNHPWTWASLVLRGWYIEARPTSAEPVFGKSGREPIATTLRNVGSFALRRCSDRHRIIHVPADGVWTLFISGPWRQKWGFFTEEGFVFYRDYESAHNKDAIK